MAAAEQGALKIGYDLTLLKMFRNIRPRNTHDFVPSGFSRPIELDRVLTQKAAGRRDHEWSRASLGGPSSSRNSTRFFFDRPCTTR
jgi:hypothetical protein